ncbi:MAG: hypothetical protein HOV97_05945 [Nonomuraea sp.]|nr:hypothetical protein [Nonomuraea sp.]
MSIQTWKGRPVPWVARWSGEVCADPLSVGEFEDGTCRVFYVDGNEVRDEHDVLWMREGITRAGEPQFGEVSIYRQRASMRKRLCQVCGQKIISPVIRWLVHPEQIVPRDDGTALTMSPPTCDSCVDLSMVACPVMKHEDKRVIARVLEYEVWGVLGIVARFDEMGRGQQTTGRNMIDYSRTDYPFNFQQVVAKQQVVRWTKFRVEG